MRAIRTCELTRATSSRPLNGLPRYSSAPAASASRRASAPARADSTITDTVRMAGSARIARTSSRPSDTGHHDVHQHQVGIGRAHRRQAAGGVVRRLDHAAIVQDAPDVVDDVGVVVDHHDAHRRAGAVASAAPTAAPGRLPAPSIRRRCRARRRRRRRRCRRRGRPPWQRHGKRASRLPSALSTSMSPPCRRTSSRTSARPMPLPSIWRPSVRPLR